jgi:hypothetical protein
LPAQVVRGGRDTTDMTGAREKGYGLHVLEFEFTDPPKHGSVKVCCGYVTIDPLCVKLTSLGSSSFLRAVCVIFLDVMLVVEL